MANSVKVVLRKKKNQDGTFPLAIRITVDRKSSYSYLGFNINEKDWDSIHQKVKKSHPNAVRLNNFIIKKQAEISDTLLSIQSSKNLLTAKAVKNKVSKYFFEHAETYLQNLQKEGKFNNWNLVRSNLKIFKKFLGKKDIHFDEITVALLKEYRAELIYSRNYKEMTIYNHLSSIKRIFGEYLSHANTSMADLPNYPFGKKGVPMKTSDSVKIGLNQEEITRIEDVNLSRWPNLHHTRNLWLFSFYLAGMRISDVLRLRWRDIQDNRLYYAMGKNLKVGSVKLSDKALKILAEYKNHEAKHNFIFPELKTLDNLDDTFLVQRVIQSCTSELNTRLKSVARRAKVAKRISTHIARHTFGNMSGKKIPIQTLQKFYRHKSIETTVRYQANFIFEDDDQALEAVIGK